MGSGDSRLSDAARPATGQADVHVALGTVLLERGRPKQAVEEFSVASRLAPERPDVFLLLGLAFDAAGRHADAAKAFARAATLPPGNAWPPYVPCSGCVSGRTPALSTGSKPFTSAWSRTAPSRRARQQPFLRGGIAAGVGGGGARSVPPARYSPGSMRLARATMPRRSHSTARTHRTRWQLSEAARWPRRCGPPTAETARGTGAARGSGSGRTRCHRTAPAAGARARCRRSPRGSDRAPAARRPARPDATSVRDWRWDEPCRRLAGRSMPSGHFRDTLDIPASAHSHFELGRLYQSPSGATEAADAFAAARPAGPSSAGSGCTN